jgi:hypothetical protein
LNLIRNIVTMTVWLAMNNTQMAVRTTSLAMAMIANTRNQNTSMHKFKLHSGSSRRGIEVAAAAAAAVGSCEVSA